MADVRYSEEHEWIRVEGEIGTIGITHYAQEQLGDVVFVEVPAAGRKVAKGEAVAVVESVKAASDIYAPVSGEVVESRMASTESGPTPAASQAFRAACSARSDEASSSAAQRRVRIPVRRSIASAFSRSGRLTSSLPTTRLGRYDPVPTILLRRTCSSTYRCERSSRLA